MIIFNNITENNDGLSFTSLFESKLVRLKVIDSYTGLVAWHDDMVVNRGGYFFSYPRKTNHYGFEVCDPDTNEIYLKLNIHNDGYFSFENIDKFKKLKDFKYINKSDDLWAAYPLYDIFINNCYDVEKCQVKEGDVVFDIGANIGLFSYYSILKGAKKVYAFEPGISQSNAIKDNFNFDNLRVEQKAVTEKTGVLRFSEHKTKSILSGFFEEEVREEDYNIIECSSVNLMEYCKYNNIEKINFLKMDCEGSEYSIFESLSDEFIENIDKISMEYHFNSDGRVKYLINRLENNGFVVETIDASSDVGNLIAYKHKTK